MLENAASNRSTAAASVHMSQPDVPKIQYRGSPKHKNRPTAERKGTLCPEWTHDAAGNGYGHDPSTHSWKDTEAHKLFGESIHLEDGRRCFATARGIAFQAKPTRDGTWHGYPVPWETLPADIVDKWVDEKKVTRKQVKEYWRRDDDDLRWAIEADMP